MTEQDQTPPELDVADLIPEDFDLDAWISGGTIAQRSVQIFARPDLQADIEEWERRYTLAETRAKVAGDERALSEDDELEALKAEGERIHAEWMASKADWRVRALDYESEVSPLVDAMPKYEDLPKFDEGEPKAPRDHTGGKPSETYLAAKAAWEARRDAFVKAQEPDAKALAKKRQAAQDEVNLQMISTAVVSITFANGKVVDGVTVAQLRAMREKLGPVQVGHLLAAAAAAMYTEPTVPVPFSRSDSKGGRP